MCIDEMGDNGLIVAQCTWLSSRQACVVGRGCGGMLMGVLTLWDVVRVGGVVYGVMSVVTLIAYVLDKRAARDGRRRTPEAVLHGMEFFGGWPGAFLAQRWVRHKNAKIGYQVVFWMIVAVHVAGWVLVVRVWR
jgi:uncharacterized membrane protein YsdA (DUF1294 family)